MPSLSPRENYLRALRHEDAEYVPIAFGVDGALAGMEAPYDYGNPGAGAPDGFGVRWEASDSAVGGRIPAPGEFILKDVTQWKRAVTMPDLGKYDWEKMAEAELNGANMTGAKIDRDRQGLIFFSGTGPWERLAALMGFEEAMIAMMEEPEACHELLTAITDFKIALAEKAAKYYRADVFMNFDDIATERNLFMSPDTYRKLIKPQHTRLCTAIKNLGMIPVQHTCGYAELCIEDYIETGAAAWNSVQTSNDIAGLLDKYGDRFCLDGGFNTNGKAAQPGATVGDVVAETERCFREYGGKKGFIFFWTLVASTNSTDVAEKNAAILETANRLRFAGK
jgi:uroporphyrinogen-III decarboxylase